jgi:ribosomal protein S6
MNKYELMLVLPGTLDDKQVEERVQEMVKIVKEHASAVETHPIGKNRLAYPIQQIRYGYFYTVTFTAEAVELKKLEDKLRLNREILRFLVTHYSTQLTAQQKIAYTAENNQVTPVFSRDSVAVERPRFVAEAPKKVFVEAVVEKNTAQVAKPLDLDAVNKKLDDLMSNDVITGV